MEYKIDADKVKELSGLDRLVFETHMIGVLYNKLNITFSDEEIKKYGISDIVKIVE